MSEKPKVDPSLAAKPAPGTRLRDPEAPKPGPKAQKKRATPATAVATAPVLTPTENSPGAASAEPGVEPGALAPVVASELVAPRPKSRRELELESIGRIDGKIRRDASRVLLHTLAAADIPADGKKPEGWSERKWRVALDARMSRREGPAYLDHAAKVYESFLRNEALAKREGRLTPSLNAQISFYVRGDINNTYNYPVIEVPEET